MSNQQQRARLNSVVAGLLASVALFALACGSSTAAGGSGNPPGGAALAGGAPLAGGAGASPTNAGAGPINAGAGGSAAAGAGGATTAGGSGAAAGGDNGGAESGGASSGGAGGAGNGGASGGGAGASSGGAAAISPQTFILYDDSNGRLLYVDNGKPSANWTANSGSGRDLQLIGGGRVLFGKSDGWDEYRLSDGSKVTGQHGFPGTEDAYRLPSGNTLLASVSGTSIVLKQVNAAGQTQGASITYPGYSYVRLVRPTPTGTYLVSADTVVFEGNDQGAVLWHVSPEGARHAWKAVRLANGNTAITTGYGATLVIYDSAGKLLQTIGGTGAANTIVGPWFYADFHVLAGGGYFVVNSQADRTFDASIQLLQYDSTGTLVWKQKQPTGVRSLEAAIILDGLDPNKLYIEPQGILIPAP